MNVCVPMALRIQISDILYQLRALSPNLMLAKVSHYTELC